MPSPAVLQRELHRVRATFGAPPRRTSAGCSRELAARSAAREQLVAYHDDLLFRRLSGFADGARAGARRIGHDRPARGFARRGAARRAREHRNRRHRDALCDRAPDRRAVCARRSRRDRTRLVERRRSGGPRRTDRAGAHRCRARILRRRPCRPGAGWRSRSGAMRRRRCSGCCAQAAGLAAPHGGASRPPGTRRKCRCAGGSAHSPRSAR